MSDGQSLEAKKAGLEHNLKQAETRLATFNEKIKQAAAGVTQKVGGIDQRLSALDAQGTSDRNLFYKGEITKDEKDRRAKIRIGSENELQQEKRTITQQLEQLKSKKMALEAEISSIHEQLLTLQKKDDEPKSVAETDLPVPTVPEKATSSAPPLEEAPDSGTAQPIAPIVESTIDTPAKKKNFYEEQRDRNPGLYALEEVFGSVVQINSEKCVFIDQEKQVVTHLVNKETRRFTGTRHIDDAKKLIAEIQAHSEDTNLPFPKITLVEENKEVDGKSYLIYQEEMAQGSRLSSYLDGSIKTLSKQDVDLAVSEIQRLHAILNRAHGDLKPQNIYLYVDNDENGNKSVKITFIDLAAPTFYDIRDKRRMEDEKERIRELFSRLVA